MLVEMLYNFRDIVMGPHLDDRRSTPRVRCNIPVSCQTAEGAMVCTLKDLGTGPDGITGAELGNRLLAVIIDRAIEIGADEMTKAGKDALNKTANEAAGKATKALGDFLNKKP